MPSGIPKTKYMHCKKCSARFKTMSEMRKHQWSHANTYDALSTTTAKPTTTEISVREFIDAPHPPVNGELTVPQLISELTSRHKFIGDMIAAIGGIQAQFKEAAHHE